MMTDPGVMPPHPWEGMLAIVVPAFNEQEAIANTLTILKARLPAAQIILVDDGSSDETALRAARVAGIDVIRHQSNRGYGAALKTGMRNSARCYIAWFDADGEHRIDDLIGMMNVLHQNKPSAVLGQRPRPTGSLVRIAGKWVLHMLTRSLASHRIQDLNCGLRVFRREAIVPYSNVLPKGYSASLTSTLVLVERGHRIEFYPITLGRRIGESKVRLSDGFGSLTLVFRIIMLFAPLRIFLPIGLACIAAGAGYGIAFALIRGAGIPVAGAIGVLAGLILISLGLIADQISQIRLSLLDDAEHSEAVNKTSEPGEGERSRCNS